MKNVVYILNSVIIFLITFLIQFMRNSKAVGVLWGVFTVCYTVLIIVVFLQVNIFKIILILPIFEGKCTAKFCWQLPSKNVVLCINQLSSNKLEGFFAIHKVILKLFLVVSTPDVESRAPFQIVVNYQDCVLLSSACKLLV